MKVSNTYPPIYTRAAAAFPLSGSEIFAYGDTIYNPGGFQIPPWLIAHEEVHQEQQQGAPAMWWDKYLVDEQFRFDMEFDAHLVEYKTYCKYNADRNKRARYRQTVARKLAAPLYGSLISVNDALRRLK